MIHIRYAYHTMATVQNCDVTQQFTY